MKALLPASIAAALMPIAASAQTIVPFHSGNKWGYKDTGGEIVVNAEYTAASRSADGMGLVASDKDGTLKWGVIDSNGQLLVEPEYDYIDLCSEGMVATYKGPVYNTDEGIYMSGGLWGFIDLNNPHEELKPAFDLVGPFTDGAAWVNCIRTDARRQRRTMPIVDKKGRKIGEDIIFGVSGSFSMEDIFLPDSEGNVSIPDGAWVLMDRNGNALTSTDNPYQAVGEFKDGLAWVKRNGLFGYVNTEGDEVIPAVYTMVQGAPGSSPGSLLLHPESGAVRWVVNREGDTAWLNEKGDTIISFTDFGGKVSISDKVSENMWDY